MVNGLSFRLGCVGGLRLFVGKGSRGIMLHVFQRRVLRSSATLLVLVVVTTTLCFYGLVLSVF